LIGVIEAWQAHRHPEALLVHGLLSAIGTSVALIGPGAASLDAWFFGWRRIDVGSARLSRLERGNSDPQ
jgi:hypothetical protein